jgi:hypothetical protein
MPLGDVALERRRLHELDRQRDQHQHLTAERIAVLADHRAAVAHDCSGELIVRGRQARERERVRGRIHRFDRQALAAPGALFLRRLLGRRHGRSLPL